MGNWNNAIDLIAMKPAIVPRGVKPVDPERTTQLGSSSFGVITSSGSFELVLEG